MCPLEDKVLVYRYLITRDLNPSFCVIFNSQHSLTLFVYIIKKETNHLISPSSLQPIPGAMDIT